MRFLRAPRNVALAALLATVVSLLGASAASAYVNPFLGEQPYVGRTDMGVDLCLTPGQPIRAVGDGVVIGIDHDWFEGEPYIWYELTSGPDAGRYVYVAEQIHRLAHVGQTLQAGQVLARYARTGTCIETGWSAADGETLAQATTGYTEGEVTQAGVSFARFLMSLGLPGPFELVPTAHGSSTHHRSHRHRRKAVARG